MLVIKTEKINSSFIPRNDWKFEFWNGPTPVRFFHFVFNIRIYPRCCCFVLLCVSRCYILDVEINVEDREGLDSTAEKLNPPSWEQHWARVQSETLNQNQQSYLITLEPASTENTSN